MAQHPRGTPKKKGPKGIDKKQSERFKETARALDADESGGEFNRAVRSILKPSVPKKSASFRSRQSSETGDS